jgi:beta propeller repeat protein
VTNDSGDQTAPDISGTIVVWQDDRGTNSEVWFRDLAGGTEAPVVDTGGHAPPSKHLRSPDGGSSGTSR